MAEYRSEWGRRLWRVFLVPGEVSYMATEITFYADQVAVTPAGALVAQHLTEAGPETHMAWAAGNWRMFYPLHPLGGPCAMDTWE